MMTRFGLREKDLIIGEIGLPVITGSGDPNIVGDYADALITWSLTERDAETGQPNNDDRLVQRLIWFILAPPRGQLMGDFANPAFAMDTTLLLDIDGALTPLGRRFNAIADRLAPE